MIALPVIIGAAIGIYEFLCVCADLQASTTMLITGLSAADTGTDAAAEI